jgi:ubiquinone/menaquinone biosynthesis C-methylase UbiE
MAARGAWKEHRSGSLLRSQKPGAQVNQGAQPMSQLVDESASDNPAALYDSFFVPAVHGPFADLLIERVPPRAGEFVLDVGCGTGAVALRASAALASKGGAVTGLDANPNMLAIARSYPVPGAQIAWVEFDASELPFSDWEFDLVLCQQALQFFPDRAASVREMRRVLLQGGRLGLSVWSGIEHQSLMMLIDEAIERHLGALPEAVSPFSLGDPEELRRLVTDAGFSNVRVESVTAPVRFSEPDQFAELTIRASASVLPEYGEMDEDLRDALISAIRQDLERPILQHLDDGYLVFTMTTQILTAEV